MKSKLAKSTMLFLLAAFSLNTAAQALYRWVDENGKVQYSDMPPPANVKNAQQKKLGDNLIEQDKLPFALKTAMQNNPVTLYANDCGAACSNARALLNKRGIPFTDRNPQTDAKAAADLTGLSGGLDVPTLVIGSNKLSGFAEGAWQSALDSAGYPRSSPYVRPPAVPAKAPPAAGEGTPPAPAP